MKDKKRVKNIGEKIRIPFCSVTCEELWKDDSTTLSFHCIYKSNYHPWPPVIKYTSTALCHVMYCTVGRRNACFLYSFISLSPFVLNQVDVTPCILLPSFLYLSYSFPPFLLCLMEFRQNSHENEKWLAFPFYSGQLETTLRVSVQRSIRISLYPPEERPTLRL